MNTAFCQNIDIETCDNPKRTFQNGEAMNSFRQLCSRIEVHDLKKSVGYPLIPNVCMSEIEITIITKAVGPSFGPGHLEG